MSVHGRIHSVESFGTVDGPGIRFVVFMQGCLMRCQYCHNRDTWDLHAGTEIHVDELMEQIESYRPFFDASHGGVTVSGGEAILQAPFVAALFEKCQAKGIHTCLDTNGFVRHYTPAIHQLLAHTDLVMLDIKHMFDDKHIELTQVSNQHTLEFAQYLHQIQQKTWIRYVIVEGFSYDPIAAKALADFIAPMDYIEKVELLPYHPLGKYKWSAMGQAYQLDGVSAPSQAVMAQIKAVFTQQGIHAV
ncbi:pyruvate formate lyase 1-activating protein [Shewanella surugensis]|uniref:Pyruvate formate-lyase-activating enzyme n=1 Tax=Shewanella surugensis TaxID=212020 RepID=A0ABT0LDA3_9GAMM|nr:pyruvate formate lyase 1-activating protein [Shewanella surugensis]MCL1125696.1 pyruvate formate lyase 1-activating protein [Shewanella surugensis]